MTQHNDQTMVPSLPEEVTELPQIECAECGQHADLTLFRSAHGPSSRDLEFRGTVTCSGDGHEWPVTIRTDNVFLSTEQMMPVVGMSQHSGDWLAAVLKGGHIAVRGSAI